MTTSHPARDQAIPGPHACCSAPSTATAQSPTPVERDAEWLRAARWARWLAWISLAWMCTEGAIGLWQGFTTGSISLIGWALGSAVEGLASIIVVWRFTGARTLSVTAERRAQRGVAVSFWLLAPYIGAESVRDLLTDHHAETSVIAIALTAAALLEMPLLGHTKHKLAARLNSAATAGEGTQNYLCAAQAGAVLLGLAITSAWPGAWWLDPVIGLGIAAVSVWEGIQSWRGQDCGC
ncbi:MAG: cation transporter [Pseudonocardiaceae bacterium]